ncbi:MAG: hypothetical protein LBE12_03280 [Planctomycetaceae bacterium]|jgi:hypothetical protein|nr:hypothetical protein [Planctomycetaceae bacterium]
MTYIISCKDNNCKNTTYATNIVDLLDNHRNDNGYFICERCKGLGYIEKSFALQEPGHFWKFHLTGAIRLGIEDETYQPFVFIVENEPFSKPDSIWFSYYKDLRPFGGRLKLGYGPGGPPILDFDQINYFLTSLRKLRLI